MLTKRGAQWLRRRAAAHRLGLHYGRAATFPIPRKIRISNQWVDLNIPSEPGQHTAFAELLLDDCYQLHWIATRSRVSRIIDIGANVGLFGVAARIAFPTAEIHAYEPNSLLARRLENQAKAAGFRYFVEAVGRDSGTCSLVLHPEQSVMTQTLADPDGEIPQIAFRETLRRIGGRADLVKLDCEGAEWQLFEDAASWQNVDCITMEYHLADGDRHDRIVRTLREIGFTTIRQQPAATYGLVLAIRDTG